MMPISFGRLRSTVLFLVISLLLAAAVSEAVAQQITATATANWTSSGSIPVPPFGTYKDNISASLQAQIVMKPATNQMGVWVIVSSNFSVSVSGNGNDPSPPGSSWSWVEENPDGGPALFLDFYVTSTDIPFTDGQLSVEVDAPWAVTDPNDAPTQLSTLLAQLPNGMVTVPTNGDFTVSGSMETNQPFSAGEVSFDYTGNASFTVSYQSGRTNLIITSVQTPTATDGNQHTFVSSDTITVKASTGNSQAGIPVAWTVSSLNSAAPPVVTSGVTTTDSSGSTTFTFSPSQNSGFVQFRKSKFTSGSRTANDPLSFEIVAVAQGQQAKLSTSGLGTLMQDETDTLRQEYVDFQLTVPPRTQVVPTIDDGTGNQYNVGNYDVMVSVALPEHFAAIQAAYRAQATVVNGTTVGIPANASLTIASGYRNPRRNKAAGSEHNTQGNISRHVLGSAFDLVPDGAAVYVNNKRVKLGLYSNLYPALCAATSSLGLHTLPEIGCCTIVDCGTGEDHTHVDW